MSVRSIVFAAAVFASCHAEAALPAFAGTFEPVDEVRLMVAIEREIVASRTKDGAARLSELRAQGWDCRDTPERRHLCKKVENRSDQPYPFELAERVNARERRAGALTFLPARGNPSLSHDSWAFREWTYPQGLSFDGHSASTFVLYVSRDQTTKIRALGDADPSSPARFEFVFDAALDEMQRPVTASRKEGIRDVEYIGLAIRRKLLP